MYTLTLGEAKFPKLVKQTAIEQGKFSITHAGQWLLFRGD